MSSSINSHAIQESAASGSVPVLVIGPADDVDFRRLSDWIETSSSAALVRDPDQALSSIDPSDPPHVIILLSSRPGLFSQQLISQLERAAPLARLITVLGSWCEGETRTGKPLTGVHRVYAHHGLAQMISELPKVARGEPSLWTAPRTATLADKMLHRSRPAALLPQPVAILASQMADYEGVASDIEGDGVEPQWCRTVGEIPVDANVIIWDCGDWNDQARRQWLELSQLQPTRGIALIDFPRDDEIETLQQGGFATLGRPYLVGDLLALLN